MGKGSKILKWIGLPHVGNDSNNSRKSHMNSKNRGYIFKGTKKRKREIASYWTLIICRWTWFTRKLLCWLSEKFILGRKHLHVPQTTDNSSCLWYADDYLPILLCVLELGFQQTDFWTITFLCSIVTVQFSIFSSGLWLSRPSILKLLDSESSEVVWVDGLESWGQEFAEVGLHTLSRNL